MKKLLATLFLGAVVSLPAAAPRAQLSIEVSTVDPLTKLAPDKWVYLVTHVVNAAPLSGKESVYAVNATGEVLQAVTCRGYFLVGQKPYITSNKTTAAPATLPPWTVTLVPAEGFDTYCKAGVDAQGAVDSYHGTLNAADRTFGNSTFVIFQKRGAQ